LHDPTESKPSFHHLWILISTTASHIRHCKQSFAIHVRTIFDGQLPSSLFASMGKLMPHIAEISILHCCYVSLRQAVKMNPCDKLAEPATAEICDLNVAPSYLSLFQWQESRFSNGEDSQPVLGNAAATQQWICLNNCSCRVTWVSCHSAYHLLLFSVHKTTSNKICNWMPPTVDKRKTLQMELFLTQNFTLIAPIIRHLFLQSHSTNCVDKWQKYAEQLTVNYDS